MTLSYDKLSRLKLKMLAILNFFHEFYKMSILLLSKKNVIENLKIHVSRAIKTILNSLNN